MRGFEQGNKVALVISECQRGVIEREFSVFTGLVDQVEERGVVAKIAALADDFRAHGMPVIHAHVAHPVDYANVPRTSLIIARSVKMGSMKVGSAEVDAVPELAPKDGDVVHTRGFSLVAFNGTDFDAQLRNRGITTVVMVGVSSNIALPGMAVCASDLGYQVVIPEDCIAGASAETHAFSVANTLPLFANVVTSADVSEALKSV